MHSLSNSGCQNCGSVENFAPRLQQQQQQQQQQQLQPQAANVNAMVASEPQELLNKMQDACTTSFAPVDQAEDLSHQVLTMIMHDIKSPLSTIQLCLEIVEALSTFTEHDDPVARALIRAQANIERVQRLADDVLMQEKIKSGTIELDAKPISLECVVKDCIDSLTALAHVQNIKIVVADVKTVVFADKIRLGQILQNLLCNAISFSPPGTSVRIACEKQQIDEREHLVISIEDSGPGIPESIRTEIFKAFRQLPNGMERNGTYGLGLAICEMLVSLHKGKIWVKANTGRGCTFCVALPCI